MSTSAVDYYKVTRCQKLHRDSQHDLAYAQEMEAAAEHAVYQAQIMLDRTQAILAQCKDNTTHLKDKIESLQAAIVKGEKDLERACEDNKPKFESVIDPQTGMKLGEKINVEENELEYLEAISNARAFMAKCLVDEAMSADRVATNQNQENSYQLDPKAIFLPMDDDDGSGIDTPMQVDVNMFLLPWCFPHGKEGISQTLEHAKYLHRKGKFDDLDTIVWLAGAAALHTPMKDLPEDVNPVILVEVMKQIRSIEDYLKKEEYSTERTHISSIFNDVQAEWLEDDDGEIPFNFDMEADLYNEILANRSFEEEEADDLYEAYPDDEPEDDVDQNSREDTQRIKPNKLTKNAWKSIDTAIRNIQAKWKEIDSRELELPTPESSDIARYNSSSHYKFKSDTANSTVDCLFDSLVNCKLRSRPLNYSHDSPEFGRVPFVIRTYNNSGFDVDGDLMAMCGDKYHNEIRSEKNFVGFQKVPCPVNLENSKYLEDLRDTNDSFKPWDENTVHSFKIDKASKNWFVNCIADAANNRIWASCSRTGEVHGFSTVDPKRGAVAKLSFLEHEVKANSRFCNGSFDLVSCGNNLIIGSGGTGRLSVWNVGSIVNEYGHANSDDLDNPVNEDGGLVLAPRIMIVDDDENFECGDLERAGDAQLLVAPLRADDMKSSTVRLYDVKAEKVLGLFSGTTDHVSISKQHCVESHSSIFTFGQSVGVVFDIRTFQPTIALHTGGDEQILGVPTGASIPVAFTYGYREHIKCWDLRMPGSHVYTMATGNTVVKSLVWHEGTSSLIASTCSKHINDCGRYGSRSMCGNRLGWLFNEPDDEEDFFENGWPIRAGHNREYFGREWHCDCDDSFVMLQYAFQNGRGMHECIQSIVSPEKRNRSQSLDFEGKKKPKV